jgi:hypothetical protein
MKQMHISDAHFGARARARCRYTLQDTLRRRVFTYQSGDGTIARARTRATIPDDVSSASVGRCFRRIRLSPHVKFFHHRPAGQ